MRAVITIILFIFASLLATGPASAEEKITIAIDQGNPPFMFVQKGRPEGIYPVLLNAIFERMDIDVDIIALPWKRALLMGKNGEVGIGGIYQTAERLKIFDYSIPIYTECVMLFVRKRKNLSVTDLTDLKGKTIGGLLGWSYGDELDRARKEGQLVMDEVQNDEANFKKLISGRLEGVLALDLTGKLIIRQQGYQDQIAVIGKPVAVNDTHLVFAKKSAKKHLLQQFNAALKSMREDGTYEQVIKNYLSQSE